MSQARRVKDISKPKNLQISQLSTSPTRESIFTTDKKESSGLNKSKLLNLDRDQSTSALGVTGCAPENWPTVWLQPNGNMQHRLKINEMLSDYLNKDLSHLDSHQELYYKQEEPNTRYQSLKSLDTKPLADNSHLPDNYGQLLQDSDRDLATIAAVGHSLDQWQTQDCARD